MGEYTGVKCPVCEGRFTDEDDIVVCPICGTPYHRACYENAGHCVNEQLHATRESWSPTSQQAEDERRYDGTAQLRCSKCGTINPPEGIFCQICGCRLGENASARVDGAGGPDPITLNAFTTPFGGVSPDEAIDGIPVREVALFIGENSHYFIPKMKEQFSGGRASAWNWPAFLFRGLYFLYRKMYLAGIGLLLLTGLMSIPAMLFNYCVLFGQPMVMGISAEAIGRAAMMGNALSIGLAVFCALSANKIYGGWALRSIRRLRQKHGEEKQYDQVYILALTKKGRTNRLLIAALLIGMFIVSMLLSYYMAYSVV